MRTAQVTISGQHEEVIVVRGDGEVRASTRSISASRSVLRRHRRLHRHAQFPLGPGDIIVLHTDGVTEAESETGELYGIERLIASAARAHFGNCGGCGGCHHFGSQDPYRRSEGS